MWDLVLGWRLTFAQVGLSPTGTYTLYSAHSLSAPSIITDIIYAISIPHKAAAVKRLRRIFSTAGNCFDFSKAADYKEIASAAKAASQ
jgi:hypothetical protein